MNEIFVGQNLEGSYLRPSRYLKSNYSVPIEHLDEALIRPGRSDTKVHFKLADESIPTQSFYIVFRQLPNQKQCSEDYDNETIKALASDFASKVPEQVFHPGKVLSFLLERKKSPLGAVFFFFAWRAGLLRRSQ